MNIKDIEREFPVEAAVLMILGKLRGEWENVYHHCLTVGLVSDILGRACGLPRIVTSAGILHDAEKRLEKRPKDFTWEEAEALKDVLLVAIPTKWRLATRPLTPEVAAGNDTLETQILNVADMWTAEDRVVGIVERAEKTRHRWPNLDWDFQINWCLQLEKKIGMEIYKRGLPVIRDPDNLLGWVQAQILYS